MSSKAKERDAETEKTVKAMRAFFAQSPLPALSTWQKQSRRERPASGPVWVSRVSFSTSDDAVRQVLFEGIKNLSSDCSETFTPPSLMPVKLEWTGYRKDASAQCPEPGVSEAQKFENLMQEVSSNITILYVHGGGYWYGPYP